MVSRAWLAAVLFVVSLPCLVMAGEAVPAVVDPAERVFYKGRWVTREYQENTDKGLVLYLGKWLPEEDAYKAKGYVKYNGAWVSPARLKSIQARQAQARERIKFSSDWKNAWAYKTTEGHFVIKSNVSPQLVEDIGKAMEQCYAELAKVFSTKTNIKAINVEVYATQQQFIDGSNAANIPVNGNVLGYFYYGIDFGIRCFYAGSPERTLSTLFHECTHLVLHQAAGDNDIPTWANEGLAVFFESAERDEKGMKLQTIPFDRLWQLKSMMKRGDISLNKLCTLKGPNQYSAEFYPQGWSLIYFLLYSDKGKFRNQFNGFYTAITKGKLDGDGIGIFKKSFGKAPDDYAPDWNKFIESLEPKTTSELVSAANTAYTSWVDFDAAQQFADDALKAMRAKDDKAKDDKVLLCNARLFLNLGRWVGDPKQKATHYAKSVDFFEQVFPPAKDSKAPVIKPRVTPRYASEHLDFARACIGAGRYEQAQDLIEDVLNKKEFEFNPDAYSCLALLAVSADDPAFRSLEVAKENVQIADDLGADQDNKFVHALICVAEGRNDKAAGFLSEAASRDEFGFGGMLYRRELARMAAAARKAAAGANGDDTGDKPKPKAKDKTKDKPLAP